MKIEIVPRDVSHGAAVKKFNGRIREGGQPFALSESARPEWLPRTEGRRIFQEQYLAIDESAEVRGAYMLKHQDFLINGEMKSIADYQLPLSEGTVDKAYGIVGVMLLADAIKKQPLLYGLGMGSYRRPLPRMLKTAGWRMAKIPFYFKVCHVKAFLGNMTALKSSRILRFASLVMAYTGIAWLVLSLFQFASRKMAIGKNVRVEQVSSFSDWADVIWRGCCHSYSMIALRDAETLKILYPEDNPLFLRMRIREGEDVIGWVVALDTQMKRHKQFGDMRVGSIVDCLAVDGGEWSCIRAAEGFLRMRGVDLVVTNQSHHTWRRAVARNGFLRGPSNYILATSKSLSGFLHISGGFPDLAHMTRGDGDGPIHL